MSDGRVLRPGSQSREILFSELPARPELEPKAPPAYPADFGEYYDKLPSHKLRERYDKEPEFRKMVDAFLDDREKGKGAF
jgi:hypothetical protein